jgi:hypothetical protein
VAHKTTYWKSVEENVVDPIGQALNPRMADFDISAAMPAFFSAQGRGER